MQNIVQRAINILKSPKTEWPVIAAEPATIGSLYVPYVLILAAIGPVVTMVAGGGFGMFRFSSGFVMRMALVSYLSSLVGVAVLAWLINVLAPTFGAQKNLVQAFKSAVYAYTAAWIAGIGGLLGVLGTLVGLAGGIYSIYLLYLGLPHTMKAPQEKTVGYTVVIIIAAIVVSAVLGGIMSTIVGVRAGLSGSLGTFGAGREAPVFDEDSPLGRLERAGRELERAEREGRTPDPTQAVGAVMGALTGSGAPVEALSTDTLKGFMPASLDGLERVSLSAERTAAMGVQIANAQARYGEGDRWVELEITDTGGAGGLMALAGWAMVEQSREDGTRTERAGRRDGRLVREVWDSADNSGEYSVVVGERFLVKAEGRARSLDDLRAAVTSVDLARLERLRNEGVKRD